MGKALRAMKRGMEKKKSSLSPTAIKSDWNRTYNAGAKQQRLIDSEIVFSILGNLEQIDGIGSKTAAKIRKMFSEAFGVEF